MGDEGRKPLAPAQREQEAGEARAFSGEQEQCSHEPRGRWRVDGRGLLAAGGRQSVRLLGMRRHESVAGGASMGERGCGQSVPQGVSDCMLITHTPPLQIAVMSSHLAALHHKHEDVDGPQQEPKVSGGSVGQPQKTSAARATSTSCSPASEMSG